MARGERPAFLMVNFLAFVLPEFFVPKLTDFGTPEIFGGGHDALRFTVFGDFGSSEGMVNTAVLVVAAYAAGVYATVMEHVLPAETVAHELSVIANSPSDTVGVPTVRPDFPVFFIVRLLEEELPSATAPKLTMDGVESVGPVAPCAA